GADPSDGSDGSADGSGSGGSGAVTNDSGSADAKPDASDVPCWGLTQPLPDPQTTAEHSCNAIIKSDLANLDNLFGAYANGEIAGFEGALTVLEGGSPTALSGTALAQIVRLADDPVGPAWALQLTVPG